MDGQQFCLRWNNHQTNLLSVFDKLLLKESFVDVTLACEGKYVKAHKMVLSACSPFFEEILDNNPCQHPVIILKDMQYADLKAIVQFMYKGEVNVSQEQLSQIIRTAESLKIKGLAEMGSDDQSEPPPKPRSPQPKQDQPIQSVRRKRDNPSPISIPRQLPNKVILNLIFYFQDTYFYQRQRVAKHANKSAHSDHPLSILSGCRTRNAGITQNDYGFLIFYHPQNTPNQTRQPMSVSPHSSQSHPSVHESPSFANVKFSRIGSNSPHHVERPPPAPSMTSNISLKRNETNLQSTQFTNLPEVISSVPQSIVKREPTPSVEPEPPVEPSQSEFMMEPTCDQDIPLEPDYDSRTSQNEFKSELQYEEVNLSDSPPPGNNILIM
ncbi:Protein bric-a-brac 2 [Nymphon striatum]|nr:Protein bric-a-brac 2 [Nymphon striatum]